MSRKRFTVDQWRAWFDEFEGCDLTVQQFCDSKGTTPNTFYNWRRRLREESVAENSGRNSFVSVKLASSPVEIELGEGVMARVSNDHHSLRPILEVLRELKAKR